MVAKRVQELGVTKPWTYIAQLYERGKAAGGQACKAALTSSAWASYTGQQLHLQRQC